MAEERDWDKLETRFYGLAEYFRDISTLYDDERKDHCLAYADIFQNVAITFTNTRHLRGSMDELKSLADILTIMGKAEEDGIRGKINPN